MVSVIIPAYNEEDTIECVVASVFGHPDVKEILVIDDGSHDKTAERAKRAGATVIRMPYNVGKAQAMNAGVYTAVNDIILFLDADNIGLTHATLSRLINPVKDGTHGMYVGIHARTTPFVDSLHAFLPILSGKRALRRAVWSSVPDVYKEGFQIEIALNYFSKKNGHGMGFEVLEGVICIPKERKYGFVKGFLQRLKMMYDVCSISFRLYIVYALSSAIKNMKEVSKIPRL